MGSSPIFFEMLFFYKIVNILRFDIENYYTYLDGLQYVMFTLVPLLIVIALFTLAERKVMASIQRRKGPNVVGIWGFLQPFADGLKLVVKEIIIPSRANKALFIFSPCFTLFLSFIGWVAIPFDMYTFILNMNASLLFIFVVSALGVYGIFLAGWASNSKYALLGSLRSIAQMISYEMAISLCAIPVVLFCGSLNINKIVYMQAKTGWFILPMLPLAVIFFISILAETNRAPFDLPEAEAELVAGYNVEYSGITFAAFFLGEYANILFMSSLFVCLFLGGSDIFGSVIIFQEICFALKIVVLVFLFIFVRANLPRFRFDQLMFIGWKIFLPLTLAFVFLFSGVLYSCNSLEVLQLPRSDKAFNTIDSLSIRF